MSKQRFYRLDKIDEYNADYNILLGERSNGKSYAVKERALQRAWKNSENKFILLRRYDLEVKPGLVDAYFKDAPISAITDGACDTVVSYRGEVWGAKYSEESNKLIRIKCLGYYRSLSQEQHYTSGSYLDVDMIIFEEFISRDYYLPNECTKLMQFVSTVARRRKIKVYLIGNTISRMCPYYTEWNLTNVNKQKQGTIDLYRYHTEETDENGEPVTVTIALEFCENSGRNSKMFFGSSAKMITSGAWDVKEVPHLPKKLSEYDILHTIFFRYTSFLFKMQAISDRESGALFWYVEPKTTPIKEESPRMVVTTPAQIENTCSSIGFKPLNSSEALLFALISEGRLFFSDNLCGADFDACYKAVSVIK